MFLCRFILEKYDTFLKDVGIIIVVILLASIWRWFDFFSFCLDLFPRCPLSCALLTSVNNTCMTCMQPMVTFFDNKLQILQLR